MGQEWEKGKGELTVGLERERRWRGRPPDS